MKKIVVTIDVSPENKKTLQAAAPEYSFSHIPFRELKEEDVIDASIIIGIAPVPLLRNCKHLEWVHSASAGADYYINSGAFPEGVLLSCASGVFGFIISEHMLAFLLTMQKQLYTYYDIQKQELWKDVGKLRTVYGSTVLILGAGDIGGEFAKRIKSLGGYTVGIQRTKKACPDFLDELHTMESLDALLPRADVVALTLPSTDATYHVMDYRRLSLMKEGAFLLNVGRGTAIDTDALCRVMNEGHLAGAAMDVTDPEPLPKGHPLWQTPNVYITPHISGAHYLPEVINRHVALAAQNITRYLKGEPLINLIDMKTGYRKR